MSSDPTDSFVMTIYHLEIINEVSNLRQKEMMKCLKKGQKYSLKYEKEASCLFKVLRNLLRNTLI